MEDNFPSKRESEKFCRNCGRKISDILNFCDFCDESKNDLLIDSNKGTNDKKNERILKIEERKAEIKKPKRSILYLALVFVIAVSVVIWKKEFKDNAGEKHAQNIDSEKACANGRAESCFDLGETYYRDDDVIRDEAKALQFYEKACSGNYAEGCTLAGAIYQQGDITTQDMEKAFQFFQKACDSNSAAGCFNLGTLYDRGRGIGRDKAKAVALHKKSFDLYVKKCDSGNEESCFKVGLRYSDGLGVAQDMFKAAKFYQKACDGKYAKGCNYLGVLFDEGDGVAKDDKKAAQLYQKACDGDDAQGCSNLGQKFFAGEGIPKDLIKAAQFYQKACDGNYAEGCNSLGVMYFEGNGVARNPGKSAQLFRKACDGNDPQGCANLSQSVIIDGNQSIGPPSAEEPAASTPNTQTALPQSLGVDLAASLSLENAEKTNWFVKNAKESIRYIKSQNPNSYFIQFGAFNTAMECFEYKNDFLRDLETLYVRSDSPKLLRVPVFTKDKKTAVAIVFGPFDSIDDAKSEVSGDAPNPPKHWVRSTQSLKDALINLP